MSSSTGFGGVVIPHLWEVQQALEGKRLPPALTVSPAGLKGIQDEPSFSSGHESRVGLFEWRLGNHRRIIR
jgi:hypothetical protein